MELNHRLSKDYLDFYEEVAKKRDAKFVGEFELAGFGDAIHWPVFYNKTKHPVGSHYFVLFRKPKFLDPSEQWYIADGGTIENYIWNGYLLDDGILYSKSRHDFVLHKGFMVDGGFDYFKTSVKPDIKSFTSVSFKIINGEVVITEREDYGANAAHPNICPRTDASSPAPAEEPKE